jgi:hypothetical protein
MLINMNRETLIFEILKSLNAGNCGYIDERVKWAEKQADKLIETIDITKIEK